MYFRDLPHHLRFPWVGGWILVERGMTHVNFFFLLPRKGSPLAYFHASITKKVGKAEKSQIGKAKKIIFY